MSKQPVTSQNVQSVECLVARLPRLLSSASRACLRFYLNLVMMTSVNVQLQGRVHSLLEVIQFLARQLLILSSARFIIFLQTIWAQIRLLPRSSLIRVHIAWFHENILSEVHLGICSRRQKQMTKKVEGYRFTACRIWYSEQWNSDCLQSW